MDLTRFLFCFRENCWLCEGMFPTRTALVKHLISAEHRCLTVLCPWCKGKTKTFTRVSDLEVHVKKSHPDLNLPKDRFSRTNGFYFAIYPHDYAKIAESVQVYESDAAYDVRRAVRNWAEGFADRKERTEKWNRGWKEGLKLAEEKTGRTKDRTNTRIVIETVNSSEERDQCKGRVASVGSRRQDEVREETGGTLNKKRKGIDGDEEERSAKQGRVSVERTDELETYGDEIELGTGDIEEEEEQGIEDKQDGSQTEKTGRDNAGIDISRNVDSGTVDESNISGDSKVKDCEGNSGGKVTGGEDISEANSESSSSSSSSSSDNVSVPEGEKRDSLRARALCILKRGAMPVCPPARRSWDFSKQLELECNNHHVLWPPTNWKALTPDQRLMAHEYVAILLENKKNPVEFPVISRKTLLDKHGFFALEGEKKPQEEEEEEDKINAKIRQYNFTYVTKVARGEIKSSRTSWSIIKTIEKADRWTDTDVIASALDDANIKIKI